MADPLAGFSDNEIAAARMGRTWPMLFVKQALAQLPVDQAYAQFAKTLQRPSDGKLSSKQLLAVRGIAEREGAFFRELEPAGESFVNQPCRTVGENDDRLLTNNKRSLYLAAFDQVATRGRSQLIEMPDKVLLDFEGEELARIDDEIELDSAVLRRNGDKLWVIDESPADALHVDQCFSLLGPNSFAFGHWIVDFLPRLWITLESGLMPPMPILIDQGMSRQHRQYLELVVPQGTQIIEVKPMQRVEIGRLWFAPTFYYAPIYPQFNSRFRYDFVAAPPDRFRRIFQALLARMLPSVGPSEGVEKIYLARKPGGHRKMTNHQAIERAAEREGFRCVHPEDLDFVEQLRLVRQAKYLVGPEGSAFFLAFFAHPGTRACVLNHPHTEYLTTVTAMLDALDVDCTVLTGPFRRVDPDDYVHHSDYEIDVDVFSEFIRNWSKD
jgi:hypothetical protein